MTKVYPLLLTFHQGIVVGVMGVIFFIYSAAFSTILLIMVLIASIIAVVAKNPDTRYQPMRDDRGSFIKSHSQSAFNTELDALGATARGESKHGWSGKSGARFDDEEEDDSWSAGSSDRARQQQQQQQQQQHQQPTGYSNYDGSTGYPSDAGSGRHMPPTAQRDSTASPYSHNNSMTSQNRFRQQQSGSPSPWQRGAGYE